MANSEVNLEDIELVSGKKAAEILGVTYQTLYKWRRDKQGPAFIKVCRRCMYRLKDLKAWVEERIQDSGNA